MKVEDPAITAIRDIDADVFASSSATAVYNLNGQRVSPETKGLLIRNGKKWFNK
ncbi:MAG: hypothetical protein K2G86_00655 [Prevotella sp.]|nr:hypothetical protein [Prevotella sp.]